MGDKKGKPGMLSTEEGALGQTGGNKASLGARRMRLPENRGAFPLVEDSMKVKRSAQEQEKTMSFLQV